MAIKFEQGAHWYSKDGQPSHDSTLREARKLGLFASVTSIDKAMFTNSFLDRWKLNELAEACANNPRMPHENVEEYANRCYEISLEKARVAAEFGKALHDAMDKYPEPTDNQLLIPWMVEFDKWYKENILETICTEKVMIDHDIGVAGRLDKIVMHKTLGRCVIDFKTQRVKSDDKGRKKPAFYDSWGRQLGFYNVCDAKENGLFPAISACLSLVIDSGVPSAPFVKEWPQDELKAHYRRFVTIGAWGYYDSKDFWPVPRWDPTMPFLMPL